MALGVLASGAAVLARVLDYVDVVRTRSSSSEEEEASDDEFFDCEVDLPDYGTQERLSYLSDGEEPGLVAPPPSTSGSPKPERRKRWSLDRLRQSLERQLTPPAETAGLSNTHWADGDATLFALRGAQYLKDRKKVKATHSHFKLAAVDLFQVQGPTEHIARHQESFLSKKRERDPSGHRPFTFVIQFMNPGNPPAIPFISIGLYFELQTYASLEELIASGSPLGACLQRFMGASPEERAKHFKLIANISSGPMLIRRVVPRKPVIVGKAVGLPVHLGDGYLEIDVNVVGSSWATRFYNGVVDRVAGQTTVDVAFLMEGQREEELPEQLIGVAHLVRVTPSLGRPVGPMPPPAPPPAPAAAAEACVAATATSAAGREDGRVEEKVSLAGPVPQGLSAAA